MDNTYNQDKKILLEEQGDTIKGRRMTDLESKIFHGWTDVLNTIDEEEINKILTPITINLRKDD